MFGGLMKVQRKRKPRDWYALHTAQCEVRENEYCNNGQKTYYVWIGGVTWHCSELRAFAKWCLKAADWLESWTGDCG